MKGSHPEAIQEIRSKSAKFSDDKVKMFPDHVKVIGDGAFFSQLMQMKDGYLDGHQVCIKDKSNDDSHSQPFALFLIKLN